MGGEDRARRLARRARVVARARRRRAHPMLRWRGGGEIRVNMAAMIDVVFLLLVYFLLIAEFRGDESSFATRSGVAGAGVAADPFALPERAITVRVRSVEGGGGGAGGVGIAVDSAVFRGVESLEAFEERAREALDRLLGAEQEFVVVPTGGTRWGDALAVVNALRLAGYGSIRLEGPGEVVGGVDGGALDGGG